MDTADKIGLLPGFGWMAGHGFFATLFICWLITPGLMFIIGVIGESRLIPWTPTTQFLSFFPGDFFLGGMVAGLLVLAQRLPAENHWFNAVWWHVLVLISTTVVALLITRGEYQDPNGYGRRAVLSPTKLYHNVVLYAGYGYVIVVTLVAIVVWLVMNSSSSLGVFMLCLVPGLIWVSLLVVEQRVSETVKLDRVRMAHVNDWEPIWRAP